MGPGLASCPGYLGQWRHGYCLFAVCESIQGARYCEFLLARRVREARTIDPGA
jgi:hypothetical protein